MRDILKKFKSKRAMMAFVAAARASLGVDAPPDASDAKQTEVPAGNMTQEEFDEAMNLPQDGDWMNDVGITELPKDCKALDAQITFIDEYTEHCKTVREQMEEQISDWTQSLNE